jgi:hypothetical protein
MSGDFSSTYSFDKNLFHSPTVTPHTHTHTHKTKHALFSHRAAQISVNWLNRTSGVNVDQVAYVGKYTEIYNIEDSNFAVRSTTILARPM